MPTDPQSALEWAKQAGLLGLAVLLGWLLKWALQALLKAKDERISELNADLEKVKGQRDSARDQVLAEKERFHRVVTRLEPIFRDQVQWIAVLARASRLGRGGESLPPVPGRGDASLQEDEGTGG